MGQQTENILKYARDLANQIDSEPWPPGNVSPDTIHYPSESRTNARLGRGSGVFPAVRGC